MEPAAVTTSSSASMGSSTNGSDKQRRPTSEFLQIDPSSTFIHSSNRNYEDLPENFLETISPQQSSAPPSAVMINDHSSSPQLAPLAPMSMASEQSSSYSLMGMGNQYTGHTALEKTNFGNGPAGLLSPLHLDSRRPIASGSDFGRHVYIKEETDQMENHLMMQQMPMSSQQQEMDRIAQAETPPAVSNVELASTMIASLIGEQRSSSPSPLSYSGPPSASLMQQRLANMKHDTDESLEGVHINGDDHEADYQRQSFSQKPARRVYSTKDSNDPLNAEIDDDIYIDTKELCKRIAFELKQHSIPQAIFAERILCRSQGTLSDLLRNPKPWNKLKSGRETFRRMFNWVQQPLSMRLGILDMFKTDGEEGGVVNGMGSGAPKPPTIGMTPPTPAQNVRHASRRSATDGGPDGPSNKRPRLVFTDIQKRTLQAIFKETQRPSREMQQTIAEHLRLDLSTVANFFMNARRRSRIGPGPDEPQPFQQQVRPVTPPPESQSPPGSGGRRRVPASMQHVEATVSSVAESAIQYSREAAVHDQMQALDDEDTFKMFKDPMTDEAGISIVAGEQGSYEHGGGVDIVNCEALTPMGDSPVDVVDRGIVKQEEDVLGEEAVAQ